MIKLKDRKGEMKDMCDETVIKFGKWALSILIVLLSLIHISEPTRRS